MKHDQDGNEYVESLPTIKSSGYKRNSGYQGQAGIKSTLHQKLSGQRDSSEKSQHKSNLPASKNVIRRRGGAPRDHAVFIDGTGLDRAARRLNKRIDFSALLRGVCGGIEPRIARYYTIIPYEDDSRHHSFLDAVRNAGLEVILKRLPPKGINRQIAVDFDMAVDIMAFGLGHIDFQEKDENAHNPLQSIEQSRSREYSNSRKHSTDGSTVRGDVAPPASDIINTSGTGNRGVKLESSSCSSGWYESDSNKANSDKDFPKKYATQKIVTVVCPSRELARPIELLNKINVDTVSVDFGQFNPGDVLKSAAKWIDLSNADTIWRPVD